LLDRNNCPIGTVVRRFKKSETQTGLRGVPGWLNKSKIESIYVDLRPVATGIWNLVFAAKLEEEKNRSKM
jgi:hypothetical protein